MSDSSLLMPLPSVLTRSLGYISLHLKENYSYRNVKSCTFHSLQQIQSHKNSLNMIRLCTLDLQGVCTSV